MAMNCAKCGHVISSEEASNPCLKCGCVDREILIQDSGEGLEISKLKARAMDGTRLFERKQGERLSVGGLKVHEFLEIDHRGVKTKKTHIVKEIGNNKIVHNESEEFPAKHRQKQSVGEKGNKMKKQRHFFSLTLVISILLGIILPLTLGVKDLTLFAISFSLVWFIYVVVLVVVSFFITGRRNLKRSKEMIYEKWGYS